MEKFDVVIIGAGPAGLAAASQLKAHGQNVAIIENDLWGGTCPNRGCDPKKVFLSGVEAKDKMAQLNGKGFGPVADINWPQLAAFKKTFTDPVSKGSRQSMVNAGITAIDGTPKFISDHEVTVAGRSLMAKQFILATGQRPRLLDIEGKALMGTSTDFLDLQEMPQEIAIVGAGYIAFELATIANAAGAKVHIIQHNDRPLKNFDARLVDDFVQQLEQKGIVFHYNVALQSIQKVPDGYLLKATNLELTVDQVFTAAGRVPNVEILDLEAANVAVAPNGILVNQYLQTSNPAIFAIGDVVAKKQPKLTPVAGYEARYVVGYLLGQQTQRIHYPEIPTVVYGSPKLAQVGVPVDEALEQPKKYVVNPQDLTNWFSYRRTNDSVAKATMVFDQTKHLVGASVLSYEADTLINLLTVAIEKQLDHQAILDLILAYPTVASDLQYLI